MTPVVGDEDHQASLNDLLASLAPGAAAAAPQPPQGWQQQPLHAAPHLVWQQNFEHAHQVSPVQGAPAPQRGGGAASAEPGAGPSASLPIPTTQENTSHSGGASSDDQHDEADWGGEEVAGAAGAPRGRRQGSRVAAALLGGGRVAKPVVPSSDKNGVRLNEDALRALFGAVPLPGKVALVGPEGQGWPTPVTSRCELRCPGLLHALRAQAGDTLVFEPQGTRSGLPAATVRLQRGDEPGAPPGSAAPAPHVATPGGAAAPRGGGGGGPFAGGLPRVQTTPHGAGGRWSGGQRPSPGVPPAREASLERTVSRSMMQTGELRLSLEKFLGLCGRDAPLAAVLFACDSPPGNWTVDALQIGDDERMWRIKCKDMIRDLEVKKEDELVFKRAAPQGATPVIRVEPQQAQQAQITHAAHPAAPLAALNMVTQLHGLLQQAGESVERIAAFVAGFFRASPEEQASVHVLLLAARAAGSGAVRELARGYVAAFPPPPAG